MSTFFDSVTLKYFRYNKNDFETEDKVTVICNNVKGLADDIVEARGLKKPKFKIGIDGGGGFLKVCLNIFEFEEAIPSRSPAQSPAHKKSAVYSGFSDSGVKKLFIIALVGNVQENFENVGLLLRSLKLEKLGPYTMAVDLKLANILAGISSHASSFPCCWCEARAPTYEKAQLRTLGRIRKMATAFQRAKDQKTSTKAQDFMSCVNLPLLVGPDFVQLIDILPPPELHIMLGAANKLFDELNIRWGGNLAYKWGVAHNICRADYHGGMLEGNDCKRLLQKAHLLYEHLPQNLKNFALALQKLDLVRTSCFGKTLDPNFISYINSFKEIFMSLEINITPKLHILFEHVPMFCQRKNQGLGIYSEQASESVHHDFNETWTRYKSRENTESYENRFKRAVINYNSFHV